MVAWRTNCPPPPPLHRQFKILYSVAWIKICSHVDNQEIYLFCQNNDIKVRILRTDFFSVGFWWSQSLLLMHVYHLTHIKNNLNPFWVEVDNTILQEDLWGVEPPATEVYGETLLVLLGRTAEKHFAGWGAVPPGDTSQFAVTTLPPVVCPQWRPSTHVLLAPFQTPCPCYSHALETEKFIYLESWKIQGRSCDSKVETVTHLNNESMNSI